MGFCGWGSSWRSQEWSSVWGRDEPAYSMSCPSTAAHKNLLVYANDACWWLRWALTDRGTFRLSEGRTLHRRCAVSKGKLDIVRGHWVIDCPGRLACWCIECWRFPRWPTLHSPMRAPAFAAFTPSHADAYRPFREQCGQERPAVWSKADCRATAPLQCFERDSGSGSLVLARDKWIRELPGQDSSGVGKTWSDFWAVLNVHAGFPLWSLCECGLYWLPQVFHPDVSIATPRLIPRRWLRLYCGLTYPHRDIYWVHQTTSGNAGRVAWGCFCWGRTRNSLQTV